jgi:membrane-associated phospholipid phosphatase
VAVSDRRTEGRVFRETCGTQAAFVCRIATLKNTLTPTFRGACLGLTVAAAVVEAQTPPAGQSTFFTRRDAVVGSAFIAASAGLSLFDPRIAGFFRDTTLSHVRLGQKLDDIFTRINESTLTIGGLAVYAIARVAKEPAAVDVALHTAESVAAASLTSQLVRGPLGRSRPQNSNPAYENQYDFHAFRGFGHFQNRAFPSIHASSGFAAASAIVAEVHRRKPGATMAVAIPAYALALTPGLSRMYLGQHWASDVFAGAFLGAFYGARIVDYSHAHPVTKVDRLFLGSSLQDRPTSKRERVIPFAFSIVF